MNSFRDIASNIGFDIAVEALAGLVMDNNPDISLEQLRVRPRAHLHKASGREVSEISQTGFDHMGRELIYFDTSRPSLFDSLPEMLFHSREIFEDEVEQAEFIARQRDNARNFFLPFEEELYKSRISIELKERTALKELNLQMLKIYGLQLERTPSKQQGSMSAFAFFLPFLDRIIGDLVLTCVVLKTIAGKEVTVEVGPSPVHQLPEQLQSHVGNASLGDTFLLGETFSDGSRWLDFTICDVCPAELEEWIPGGTMRTLLEEKILPYLLPAEENYTVHLGINNSGSKMMLGDEQSSNVLGYAII